jgi:hypothetical protein
MMICADHIKLWWFCSISHQDDNHQKFDSIRDRHCEHSQTYWLHLVDVSSDEMRSLKSSKFWKLLTSALLLVEMVWIELTSIHSNPRWCGLYCEFSKVQLNPFFLSYCDCFVSSHQTHAKKETYFIYSFTRKKRYIKEKLMLSNKLSN